MARLPRLALSRHLHHVAQAGINGGSIVQDDSDCLSWVSMLSRLTRQHGVALHAWLLLPQRFHLLVTPTEATGLSRQEVIQRLSREHRPAAARHHVVRRVAMVERVARTEGRFDHAHAAVTSAADACTAESCIARCWICVSRDWICAASLISGMTAGRSR